jgi:hypothetical protein
MHNNCKSNVNHLGCGVAWPWVPPPIQTGSGDRTRQADSRHSQTLRAHLVRFIIGGSLTASTPEAQLALTQLLISLDTAWHSMSQHVTACHSVSCDATAQHSSPGQCLVDHSSCLAGVCHKCTAPGANPCLQVPTCGLQNHVLTKNTVAVWAKEHRVVTAAHARLPDGAPHALLFAHQRPRHAMVGQVPW